MGSGTGLAGAEGGFTNSLREQFSSHTFSAITFAIGCLLLTTAAALAVVTTLQC